MKTFPFPVGAVLGCLIVFCPDVRAAARITSDLVPPQKRQVAVETAQLLVRRKAPEPLPADLASPFNPVDFDKPDPSEVPVPPPSKPNTPAGSGPGAGSVQPVGPASDRETLQTLAAQITPSGMMMRGGSPLLIFANKPFVVGTRFTASYNNQDYELELVAIDRTTFTLRYRGEEITRPIKPVR